jgi:ceramide glucosyltransferase
MVGRVSLFTALAGLVSSAVYLLLVLIAAFRWRFARPEPVAQAAGEVVLPPVTVLKPLQGTEPFLEQNLESFFRQDYPCFELIFGARFRTDPALQVVEALQKKYPGVKTRIVLSGEPAYPNAKVYALEKMVAVAHYPYLVITDSDVQVKPNFLAQVVRPLLDSSVGMVTCIYRGVPSGGLWSRLEALGMSVEMPSGVLVAEMVEGMKFALGPGMATRKDVLARFGGIRVLGAYCSDDFLLGQLTDAVRKKVVLSRHVIDHVAMNRSARASLAHQLRWMKSTRFSRPLGHAGTGLTFAMPFGLVGLAAGIAMGSRTLGFGLLGVAVLNRVVQSIVIGWGVLRDWRALWFCWLYPVRDLLGFLLWAASYFGTEIVWRGEHYQLGAAGKMTRKAGPLSAAPKSARGEAQGTLSGSVTVDHLP